MKSEFSEFKHLSLYKDYHKNNIVIWSYIGCIHNPTAEKIHPCYRIKVINGVEAKQFITHGDLIAEKLRRGLGLDLITPTNKSSISPLSTTVLTALQKSEPLITEEAQSPEI